MAAQAGEPSSQGKGPGIGDSRTSAHASSIRFEDVTKTFSGALRPAVSKVTLNIEPGQFVVLLGPSGCGKTTLLKLVNRLYEPTSGRILIDGKPNHFLPAPQLRRGIGYVIQQSGLFPHMRVEANIAAVPKLLNWDRGRIAERVDELLDLVGLPPAEFRRRYPTQLSGGEQQRVGLARALAANPTMLLMDEPFGALDAIARSRLQEELRSIHSRLGQTVLFVTHDVEEAVRLADRIAVMRTGHVVQYDEPARIVLQPANQFVSDLIGSHNVMRRLSLMSVRDVLQPLRGPAAVGGPKIPASRDLRSALGLLLQSGQRFLVVVDEDDLPVGTLSLDQIQARTANTAYKSDGVGSSRP